MRKNVAIILIIIAVIICSIAPPIRAENEISNEINNAGLENTIEGLQNQQEEVQTNIDEKQERLEYLRSVLSETQAQLQEINEKIVEYEKEINSLGTQAEELEKSIADVTVQLEAAEARYEEQREAFETRLVALYEAGETTYLDVLLSSKSLTEFISTYYMIEEIAKCDNEQLQDIGMEKLAIQTAKEALETQRKQYKVAKDNKEKIAITLENTKIIRNNYISQLTEEELQLQAEIDQYYEAINEIEAEIIMLTTANIGTDYAGGAMAWPVPGYSRITSPFGMRTHPITGVYKLHTGTDISAPIGANFISANDGIVIKASYNRAYGNMVIVDHGGGVSTLYAHGSEILVEVGQTVKKGEAVLKVGSTGYSTGAHAHFEIRINGEYVDPMNFVKPN